MVQRFTQSPGFGSLAYMAPEQIEGSVSSASDQYAMGCIAYELVTGRQPFMAFSLRELTQKQLIEQPVAPRNLDPQLPTHIEAAILKAMAKQPLDRFADIRAFMPRLNTSATQTKQRLFKFRHYRNLMLSSLPQRPKISA